MRFHMRKIPAADVQWAVTRPEMCMWEGLKPLLHICFPVYSSEVDIVSYKVLQGAVRTNLYCCVKIEEM